MKTTRFIKGMAGLLITASVLISCTNTVPTKPELSKQDESLFRIHAIPAWRCTKGTLTVYTDNSDTLKKLVGSGYTTKQIETINIQAAGKLDSVNHVTVLLNILPQGYWVCTGKDNDFRNPRTTTQFDQAAIWIKAEHSQCTYIPDNDSSK